MRKQLFLQLTMKHLSVFFFYLALCYPSRGFFFWLNKQCGSDRGHVYSWWKGCDPYLKRSFDQGHVYSLWKGCGPNFMFLCYLFLLFLLKLSCYFFPFLLSKMSIFFFYCDVCCGVNDLLAGSVSHESNLITRRRKFLRVFLGKRTSRVSTLIIYRRTFLTAFLDKCTLWCLAW